MGSLNKSGGYIETPYGWVNPDENTKGGGNKDKDLAIKGEGSLNDGLLINYNGTPLTIKKVEFSSYNDEWYLYTHDRQNPFITAQTQLDNGIIEHIGDDTIAINQRYFDRELAYAMQQQEKLSPKTHVFFGVDGDKLAHACEQLGLDPKIIGKIAPSNGREYDSMSLHVAGVHLQSTKADNTMTYQMPSYFGKKDNFIAQMLSYAKDGQTALALLDDYVKADDNTTLYELVSGKTHSGVDLNKLEKNEQLNRKRALTEIRMNFIQLFDDNLEAKKVTGQAVYKAMTEHNPAVFGKRGELGSFYADPTISLFKDKSLSETEAIVNTLHTLHKAEPKEILALWRQAYQKPNNDEFINARDEAVERYKKR